MTTSAVDSRVRDGSWEVVWPGTYADGGSVLTAEQLGHAAVLASRGEGQPVEFGRPDPATGQRRRGLVAVAAGRLAARVWQLPLIDDDDPATGAQDWLHSDVAVRLPLPDVHHAGRVLHRHQLSFGAGDLTQTSSGLWITTPLRTLIDCRLLLTHEALVCAMDGALHRGLVSAQRLGAAARRIERWRGAPAFRAAAAVADGRAESPGETLTRLVLAPVLPGLVPQVQLFDHAVRLVARFDLGDEELKLAVEFDGRRAHAGEPMVAKDRGRDLRTEPFGWTTERVRWFEVRRQQEAVRRRVLSRAERLRSARR
ncbi:MAG TPA: hypothetical protein VNU26_03940 [Mycobacteriales bacterium]|nr:hypothetical protein [Mycobacteriales bacterium]